MNPRVARASGVSLLEMLIAMSIFTWVMAALYQFNDYVMKRVVTVRNEMELQERMVLFLGTISADVRTARQIIYTAPAELGIWRADENGDSAPDSAETVGYAWDGDIPGRLYRQAGFDSQVILPDVRGLEFRYDQESPNTRHVIVHLSVGRTDPSARYYHYSLNLRASDLF